MVVVTNCSKYTSVIILHQFVLIYQKFLRNSLILPIIKFVASKFNRYKIFLYYFILTGYISDHGTEVDKVTNLSKNNLNKEHLVKTDLLHQTGTVDYFTSSITKYIAHCLDRSI